METWVIMLIGVLGAAGVVIPYYIITKRRAKSGSPGKANGKVAKEESSVLCRVYDNNTRTAFNDEIPMKTVEIIRAKHDNMGRKWLRDGKWLYALNKDIAGEYSPVRIPQTMEDPPSSIHRALLQDAVSIFYDVSVEKGFFQQHGKILLFVGAVIFLLWTVIMG